MEKIYNIINKIKNISIYNKDMKHEFKKPEAYKNINSSKYY